MPQTRPTTESFMGMDRPPSFESQVRANQQEQAAPHNKRAKRTPLQNSPMDQKIIDGVNIMQLGLAANAVDALVNDNLNDVLSG